MDVDDSSACLEALKTLSIECFGGDVRASPYVVAALASGAPIVREALALDPHRLRLPFGVGPVAAAMALAHAPNIDLWSADPPFRLDDVDAIRDVADVFDFFGARAQQDHVISLAFRPFERLPLEAKGRFLNVVFRHGDERVWAKFVRATLSKADFWSSYKRDVFDRIDAFTPRVVCALVRELAPLFPPAWTMTAACRRLVGALDAEGALELAAAPYAERSHPLELFDVSSAALTTIGVGRRDGRLGRLVAAALENARDVADPGLSSSLHAGDLGAAGNVFVIESVAVSVLVRMAALEPRAAPRRRTLHKHVSFEVSHDAFSISIDLGSLDNGVDPRFVACRMAVVSDGVPEAEEWFAARDGPTRGRRFVFASGQGSLPPGGASIALAADRDPSCALRVDLFYSDATNAYFLENLPEYM